MSTTPIATGDDRWLIAIDIDGTLVHDDVLDGADQRHGADTPNRTHGAHAIVAANRCRRHG